MKVGEVEIPSITGDMSITYRPEMDVSSRDIYADLPADVLQVIAGYEPNELQDIMLKIFLALRLGEERVLSNGEHLTVFGETVIKE